MPAAGAAVIRLESRATAQRCSRVLPLCHWWKSFRRDSRKFGRMERRMILATREAMLLSRGRGALEMGEGI